MKSISQAFYKNIAKEKQQKLKERDQKLLIIQDEQIKNRKIIIYYQLNQKFLNYFVQFFQFIQSFWIILNSLLKKYIQKDNRLQQRMQWSNKPGQNKLIQKVQTKKHIQNGNKRILTNCNLSTSISALAYGVTCLILNPEAKTSSKGEILYQCILSIHQQYINILHIIIQKQKSVLVKLNQIISLSRSDSFTESKLSKLLSSKTSRSKQDIYYLVISLLGLPQPIVLVFKNQSERQFIEMGLTFFNNQAKYFYTKLSQYDPFKAESIMLFIQADKDGGNLLDIQEIISILHKLKIDKERPEVQGLYEREGLKKPKSGAQNTDLSEHQTITYELAPLAFEYLLRYYSIKEQLAHQFKQYCPIFKIKSKNHKNSIVDIIKSYQKPVMSSSQLKNFYTQKLLDQSVSIQQLDNIISKFPIYDGYGKEKLDKTQDQLMLLSFNNFCNLIFSKQNSLTINSNTTNSQQTSKIYKKQDSLQNPQYFKDSMVSKVNRKGVAFDKKGQSYSQRDYLDYSLVDYYIYTDLSFKNPKRKQKSDFIGKSIMRGCKCISLNIQISSSLKTSSSSMQKNLNQLIIQSSQKQQQLSLQQVLKNIKLLAFKNNNLPFWIVFNIDNLINHKVKNLVKEYLDLLDYILQDTLADYLFVNKSLYTHQLPSPNQLQNKILLMTSSIIKTTKLKSINDSPDFKLPEKLLNKFVFTPVKLDFQRKGQNFWNTCFLTQDKLKNYEQAEEENISNYSKKLMIFSLPKSQSTANYDPFTQFRQGVHFTGLNYQKNNAFNYLIHSKFGQLPTQKMGYLLKPQYMRSQNSAALYSNRDFSKALYKIQFNIISGQKLLTNQYSSLHLQSQKPQFYIQVLIKGSLMDEKHNTVYKSQKKYSGFYTNILLDCQFLVYNQKLFTILIMIKNSINNKVISATAVSLANIRQGLRSLQILTDSMEFPQNTYLLVNYKKLEDYKNDKLDQKTKKNFQDFLK